MLYDTIILIIMGIASYHLGYWVGHINGQIKAYDSIEAQIKSMKQRASVELLKPQ